MDVDELSPSHCNIGIRETQKEGTRHLDGDVATSEGSLQGEQPVAWEELPMPPTEGMDVQRSHTPGQDQSDTPLPVDTSSCVVTPTLDNHTSGRASGMSPHETDAGRSGSPQEERQRERRDRRLRQHVIPTLLLTLVRGRTF